MPTFTWETDGALRTELLTHNTGEFPSEDAASTLSQILQAEVPEKYYVLIGLHQQTTKYMESPKNGTLSMVT